MSSLLLQSIAALALLACGWLAGAWFYKRRIAALRQLLKSARQTATEHSNQARRQIGQLQAELARRPPPRQSQRTPPPAPPDKSAAEDGDTEHERVPADGFAKTLIMPSGFAPTQAME